MHRPHHTVGAGVDVILGREAAAANQRLGGAIVVRQVEIVVERDRMRDGQVVRLVARARIRPVSDEPEQRQRDDDAEDAFVMIRCTGRGGHGGPHVTAQQPGRV